MYQNNNPNYGNQQPYYEGQPLAMNRVNINNQQNYDIENNMMQGQREYKMNLTNQQYQQYLKQQQLQQQQQIQQLQQLQYQQQQQQQKNKRQNIHQNSNVNKSIPKSNQMGGIVGISDKSLRRGFIRKVLAIICLQLIITFAFVIPSTLSNDYRDFQIQYSFITFIALILNIGIMITLYCFRKQCMIVPRNYILLFLFTISEGYLISMLTAVSDPEVVLLSAGITLLIVTFLTIYAVKTDNDITQKVTSIFYLGIALLVLILVGTLFYSYFVQTLIGLIIVGLFSFYLVYDIQRLQGGKTYAYSYDQYIIAALDIYINVIVLFQTILCLFSRQ